MQVAYKNSPLSTPTVLADSVTPDIYVMDVDSLANFIGNELQTELRSLTANAKTVAMRIAKEVERICLSSPRIQQSGNIPSWQMTLGRHRLQKCLNYYRFGVKQGRVELHSTLGAIAYRYVAPSRESFGFQARYQMLEDFLQGFYLESLKAFRREHQTQPNYTPRTQLEVAEYLAFTEQYARRRIGFKKGSSQQLIVLRAQGFARHQPPETMLDMDLAAESGKGEEVESQFRSPVMQQVRASMVSEATDPTETVLRERVIEELIQYLESIDQKDCVNYLVLKLQDLSAAEIDQILGLPARQRDYLQQRFKYYVERFARAHQWQLVHQWLGADLDQNLGLTTGEWQRFVQHLSPQEQQMLQLKQTNQSEQAIATALKLTPKQLQKRWSQLLEQAWEVRNGNVAYASC